VNVSYVQPKDVLVVRDADNWQPEAFAQLAKDTNCTVVFLSAGATLETLDEEAMAAAGWVRVDPHARFDARLTPCDCGTHMRPSTFEAG
jgi:hypothetical protein